MKAIRVVEHGGPEVLVAGEHPAPELRAGHALVRVAAAGVNMADVLMRLGPSGVPCPFVPGVEGAGIVEAVGDGVEEVAVGDRVAWSPVKQASSVGSYAERALVGGAQLMPIPDDVSLTTAAGTILQGLTAAYLVNDIAEVGPGRTVLVHAAAGGTGRMVVQWATHLGADVIGTVSSQAKSEVARAAGAAHVVRYDREDVAEAVLALTNGRGAEYVVDGVGGAMFSADLRAVADRGHIVVFGRVGGLPERFSAIELVARSISVTGGYMVNYLRNQHEVAVKADMVWSGVCDGWLVPLVEAVPLGEAASAHRRLQERATVGKLVLEVDGSLR